MPSPGYLYVLANSAMPGLVKVGKTTRTPSQRSQELSGVTGLPTPFIVVFEQRFEDCDAAEKFVHAALSDKGFRVAKNREFFSAPANEIVRVIATTPGALFTEPDSSGTSQNESTQETSIDTDIEGGQPWSSVLRKAYAYLHGAGMVFQDTSKATELFQQAALLGSVKAYAVLGEMAESKPNNDKNRAIEFYMSGAEKGNAYCSWRIAMLFLNDYRKEQAEMFFTMFMKYRNADLPANQHVDLINWEEIDNNCVTLLREHLLDGASFPEVLYPLIAERAKLLHKLAKQNVEALSQFLPGDDDFLDEMDRPVVNYLEDYLKEAGELE